jgi:hypothetical protein
LPSGSQLVLSPPEPGAGERVTFAGRSAIMERLLTLPYELRLEEGVRPSPPPPLATDLGGRRCLSCCWGRVSQRPRHGPY